MKETDPSPIGLWDDFWSKSGPLETPSPVVDEVGKLFGGILAEKKVLEVGAGSGRDIVALAQRGARAYANDRSDVARSAIAALAERKGVRVEIDDHDLRALPFEDDFFDAVYSQGVVEHFPDHVSVLREQFRVVRPGGFVIVDVPQTYNPYTIYKHALMALNKWPAGWEKQFSPAELREEAARFGARLVRLYSWGEHGPLVGKLIGWLDRNPWTATCVGAILEK